MAAEENRTTGWRSARKKTDVDKNKGLPREPAGMRGKRKMQGPSWFRGLTRDPAKNVFFGSGP